jgi:nitroreductase
VERKDIEVIIDAAAQAPSGDNAQPWRFVVRGNSICLYNIPGRDDSPYNYKERGSFFAHGAAIENMVIAGESLGYASHVSLFPVPKNNECVAKIVFSKEKNPAPHVLLAAIHARSTNRKPYQKTQLTAEHQKQLEDIRLGNNMELFLVADPSRAAALTKILSLSDQLIFEDHAIHRAIFGSIRWTSEQEEKKKGLHVKTLELPPPARAMFSLLRHPGILRFLNHFGISKFIAKQSAANYAASSAIGAITIPEIEDVNFVEAGRAFERLWLTATMLGLSIQPVTALVYLHKRIAANEAGSMALHHREAVVRAEKDIHALFGDPRGTIAMIFRIGYANPPSARSKKSKPEVVYELE